MRSVAAGVALIALTGLGGIAMAVEEPSYDVLQRYDRFEVRRYVPCVVAETTVQGDFLSARSEAFRRLFAYISGNNTGSDRIAMTAPVNQRSARSSGEKIAMTVPVLSNAGSQGERHTMQFLMPAGATRESLPVPSDSRVRLREIPERLVAVRRYSGNSRQQRFLEQADELVGDLQEAGVEATAEPELAVYNGPFTLGPFRRNEVVIEIGSSVLAQLDATPADTPSRAN